MSYVDGYALPVPKKNIKAYMAMAKKAGKIWRDHGALQYCEAAGDDLGVKVGIPFPKMMKTKKTETVVFAWVVFKSRAHRDSVNKKVMKDPRINEMCDSKDLPFDWKRMSFGGFKIMVDA